ncbi:MAG: MarR family transcriptional regulator [bacterium]
MPTVESELHQKYKGLIEGTISCYDRLIIQGSLSGWGFVLAMASYLRKNNLDIKDFFSFAKEKNEAVRRSIEKVAMEHNCPIEFIRSPQRFNKEEHIQEILQERGMHEGIVKIYSVMEVCDCYESCYEKESKRFTLTTRTNKCVHFYIYFIDKKCGLCFLRIPTYIPFRVQFYMNGHNLLANKLKEENIKYKMEDNAFIEIEDYTKASELFETIRIENLHKWLDVIIKRYIPFLEETEQFYRWTIMQAEYSTDIIFKQGGCFQPIYDQLILNSIHAIKPNNIAMFFDRRLCANYKQRVCGNYNLDIQGTRIKHYMGVNSIKMYNKARNVLRVETTINKINEIKVWRTVNKKSGSKKKEFAIMKKTIYSLHDLGKYCQSANHRYLDFIAAFDDNSAGKKNLEKLSEKIDDKGRSSRGFNLFDPNDEKILLAIESGEFNIHGLKNKTLKKKLGNELTANQISRILRRLLVHKIIKKIKNTYKYYLTKFGKRVLAGAFMVKELNIIPAMSI